MFPDFIDDRVIFFTTRFVDAIVVVFARDRPIRRNHVDVEFVDIVKLGRFRLRGAGHAGELLVKPEIILDRDRCQRLRLAINLDAFFRFDCLV